MRRRRWFDLHSWVGLHLSVLMSFVLITGTLATISLEFDWLANPSSRVYSLKPAENHDWVRMLENAQSIAEGDRLLSISRPADPWFATEVIALDDNNNRYRIFIDPHTNEVKGEGNWFNWQRFFRQTHRHLMLPVAVGVTIVGLLSLPLWVSFFSGIIIYRKWWKGFVTWPKKQQSKTGYEARYARAYWRDMHRLIGVWSLPFILVIALTGTWYLLEQWGMRASFDPPMNPLSEGLILDSEYDFNELNTLIDKTSNLHPELNIREISLPSETNPVVTLRGQADAVLVRNRANQISFNVLDQSVIDLRKGDEQGLHVRISEAADPLHFGNFGNAVTRFVWFLFGTMMSVLSLSGVYIFGLRTAGKSMRENAKTIEHKNMDAHCHTRVLFPQSILAAWQHMSWWLKWASTALLLICLILAFVVFVLP